MNQVFLSGNLGGDPEVFFSGNGDPISSFNLAFNSSRKKEDTNWIRITCFNKLSDICQKYLHKGAKITVIGNIQQEKWEKDGETKSTFKIIANRAACKMTRSRHKRRDTE